MDRLDNESLRKSIKILHSYLRMSTLEQQLGLSEARQVNRMREWTLTIPAVFDESYKDIGLSGFTGSHRSHGALGRFLDAVKSGDLPLKGRALGIESFDRLTREHSWDADTLINERKKVVVLIFKMAADGFSATEIANHLNATSTRTFTGTPEWRRNQVQWILANKAVLGVYVPGHYVEDKTRKRGRRRVKGTDGEIEGYYPRIISEDLWKRARKVIDAHQQSGRGRKGAALTNLVSGLVYCKTCGAKAHYANGYLRCSMSLQRACENTTGFPYAALEANLMKLGDFAEFVTDLFEQKPRPNTTRELVANLEAEIARKNAALDQMVRDYAG